MSLANKLAIVTGASSGIGRATTRLLAQAGVKVIMVARRREHLDSLAQELKNLPGEVYPLPADLARMPQIDGLFEEVAQIGPVDILINSAGIGVHDYVEAGKLPDWQRMVDINLMGLMYATQKALKVMRPRRSGHIVNISSVAGRIGIAGWAVYCATKWGVNGFSDAVRREVLKENIRITVIEPGVVETEWGENMPESFVSVRKSVIALQPEDVARTILFALQQPEHVGIHELLVRPSQQER